MSPHERDLYLDKIIDTILDAVSEIQAQAAEFSVSGECDGKKVYMEACEIEYGIDLLRELRKTDNAEQKS